MTAGLQPAEKTAFTIIDRWLSWRAAYGELPGFQASIRRDGRLVFSKAYGFANEPKKIKYTPSHLGHIASHSKMFTACAALRLMTSGAWSIHDPAALYLPWLKKHKDKRMAEVTLRDLMTNRSGMFRDGLDATFWELEKPFLSRAQLQREIMAADLVFAPNTVGKYSNMGFGLLGLALEAVTGRPYNDLVTALVLDRLPKHSLAPDYGILKNARYADGHTKKFYGGKSKTFRHFEADGLAAATGFCGNTDSTTLFVHEYYNGKSLIHGQIQRDLHNLSWPMANVPDEHYGLGTQANTHKGLRYMGHTGGYPGFSSQTRCIAKSPYVFGFIMNTNQAITLGIVQGMAGILHKVTDSFGGAELKNMTVTEPMVNKWGAAVYAVGRNRAIGFPLDTWQPAEESVFLDTRRGKFYADKINGWAGVGEEYIFTRKKGQVISVKTGAHTTVTMQEFLRRSKRGLQ